MKNRIPGFDLARAYALFGMFIVNYNYSFGRLGDLSFEGRFLNLFTGNSTSIFILLSGMGLSFLARNAASPEEKRQLRSIVLKRSWFLVAAGLLLFLWWPGDILHYYGAYMHIAAFLLFVPKRWYLISAAAVIVIYHLLLLAIPVETGWDFVRFQPTDFWTVGGFFRNMLYNGWNSVFPWIAYFLTGMWLGRLDWTLRSTRRLVFFSGLTVFIVFEGRRFMAMRGYFGANLTNYIMSNYFPPYLPFMVITAGFALMVIPVAMLIGERFSNSRIVLLLAATGSMTLTHYVLHLTAGALVFSAITGIRYTGAIQDNTYASAGFIAGFAVAWMLLSIGCSYIWIRWFPTGPLELLLRKFSG
jgi:uncharacterized protein